MKLPKSVTTVTPLSKAIALLLFISLPILAYMIGLQVGENNVVGQQVYIPKPQSCEKDIIRLKQDIAERRQREIDNNTPPYITTFPTDQKCVAIPEIGGCKSMYMEKLNNWYFDATRKRCVLIHTICDATAYSNMQDCERKCMNY